jgi:hypothetical protein
LQAGSQKDGSGTGSGSLPAITAGQAARNGLRRPPATDPGTITCPKANSSAPSWPHCGGYFPVRRAVECGGCRSVRRPLMRIVGGLDVHRRQITFDYLHGRGGHFRRGRIAPADRMLLRRWLEANVSGASAAFAGEACTSPDRSAMPSRARVQIACSKGVESRWEPASPGSGGSGHRGRRRRRRCPTRSPRSQSQGDQDRRSAAPRIVVGLDTHEYTRVAVALHMVGEYSPS